jgi:hypothetical protein
MLTKKKQVSKTKSEVRAPSLSIHSLAFIDRICLSPWSLSLQQNLFASLHFTSVSDVSDVLTHKTKTQH